MTETDQRLEELLESLVEQIATAIESRKVQIHSWDNFGKETFLNFDAFNLGLTNANEIAARVIYNRIQIEQQQAKATNEM